MFSNRFFLFFRYLNFHTIRRIVQAVLQQRLPSLASEMAYNAILALFPAILAMLTAIGIFAPLTNSFERMVSRFSQVAPEEVMILIENFAREISAGDTGLFSASFLVALWASSGALSAAMRALDQIHKIPPTLARPFWKARLISLGLTVGTIVLLVSATALVFVSDWIVNNVARQSASLAVWLLAGWRLLALPLSLGIMSIAFAFVYRFGPSRWSDGKPLMPGAVLAAVSWALISNLFRYYVSHFGNYNRVYGTVGTFIVLLLWLYLSSLIMLVGDQTNVIVGEAMQRDEEKRLAGTTVRPIRKRQSGSRPSRPSRPPRSSSPR